VSGEGSTFSLRLPARVTAPPPEIDAPTPTADTVPREDA